MNKHLPFTSFDDYKLRDLCERVTKLEKSVNACIVLLKQIEKPARKKCPKQ